MGLLSNKNGAEDYEIAARSALRVAAIWNENGGPDRGFKVFVGQKEINNCCEVGSHILKQHFPDPPGPFKRVAAFIVAARLYPFFSLDPKPHARVDIDAWISRLVAMLIPATLIQIKMDLSTDKGVPNIKQLDGWRGFPSPHYKQEFLAFLEWLDALEWIGNPVGKKEWEQMQDGRFARMTLATSLIVEACYYCGEIPPQNIPPNVLRGQCRACIDDKQDLTPLTYDALLYQNAAKRASEAKGTV